MLTFEKLESMEPGEVFAKGYVGDDRYGINMTNSGKCLGWIAKRGDIPDWVIYCHWGTSDDKFVEEHGDKVPIIFVKKLIDCTDEALEAYRV